MRTTEIELVTYSKEEETDHNENYLEVATTKFSGMGGNCKTTFE